MWLFWHDNKCLCMHMQSTYFWLPKGFREWWIIVLCSDKPFLKSILHFFLKWRWSYWQLRSLGAISLTFSLFLFILTYQLVSWSTNFTSRGMTVYRRYAVEKLQWKWLWVACLLHIMFNCNQIFKIRSFEVIICKTALWTSQLYTQRC